MILIPVLVLILNLETVPAQFPRSSFSFSHTLTDQQTFCPSQSPLSAVLKNILTLLFHTALNILTSLSSAALNKLNLV